MLRLALVLAALLVSPAAADWVTRGADPGRTGAGVEGPLHGDIAYEIRAPGMVTPEAVVIDRVAYLGVDTFGHSGGPEVRGLYRLPLDTGLLELIVEAPPAPPGLGASIVTGDGYFAWRIFGPELYAFRLDGEPRWTFRPFVPGIDPEVDHFYYTDILIVDKTVYVAYAVYGRGFVDALDLATGALQWSWSRTLPVGDAGPSTEPEGFAVWQTLAYAEGRLFVYVTDETSNPFTTSTTGIDFASVDVELWALAADTGQRLWGRSSERITSLAPPGAQPLGPVRHGWVGGTPTVADAAYLRLDSIVGLNPANGREVWATTAGQADRIEGLGTNAFGVSDGAVYAATAQTLYRLDAATGDIVWQRGTGAEHIGYSVHPIVTSKEIGYVHTVDLSTQNLSAGMEAFQLHDGERLFTLNPATTGGWPMTFFAPFVVDDGIALFGQSDGRITVVGKTGASLGLPSFGTLKAVPGVPVQLDLTARPGLGGPPTSYRVDWGDGNVTAWQVSPAFEHVYRVGSYEATLQVENAAGHRSREHVQVQVAQPQTPTLVEEAAPGSVFRAPLARENQDLTFGVLGIVVALIGALFGVYRTRRHRRYLRGELAYLERGYSETAGDALSWEAVVEESGSRIREHHGNGRLTDGQVALLHRRTEELNRARRLSALETDLAFLPYGLVRSLQKMLRDGHLTQVESDAVARALDEESSLTTAQRRRAKSRLADWVE